MKALIKWWRSEVRQARIARLEARLCRLHAHVDREAELHERMLAELRGEINAVTCKHQAAVAAARLAAAHERGAQ